MKRLFLIFITLIFAFNFAFATDAFLKNDNNNTTTSVADVICPGGTIFGQLPEGPDGDWEAHTSDFDAGYIVIDNFWDLETPICGIHFWGLSLIYNNRWYSCSEELTDMIIAFWNGDEEDPSYIFDAVVRPVPVGIFYADYYGLYEFTIEFPPINITGGSVAVVSDFGGCCFLWMNSYGGDLQSGQYNFDSDIWTNLPYDFSFCLIGCSNDINETKILPTKVDMLTNYPNPFNAQTMIEFSLKESGNVSIEIYDLIGRRVDNINMGYLINNQIHSTSYDAGGLSSGIYFYKLVVDGIGRTTQKLNLIK